jgi:hypothetical protein
MTSRRLETPGRKGQGCFHAKQCLQTGRGEPQATPGFVWVKILQIERQSKLFFLVKRPANGMESAIRRKTSETPVSPSAASGIYPIARVSTFRLRKTRF